MSCYYYILVIVPKETVQNACRIRWSKLLNGTAYKPRLLYIQFTIYIYQLKIHIMASELNKGIEVYSYEYPS